MIDDHSPSASAVARQSTILIVNCKEKYFCLPAAVSTFFTRVYAVVSTHVVVVVVVVVTVTATVHLVCIKSLAQCLVAVYVVISRDGILEFKKIEPKKRASILLPFLAILSTRSLQKKRGPVFLDSIAEMGNELLKRQ